MKSTILITGSSSGIGKSAAQYFNDQGWNVAATMRRPENEQDLKPSDSLKLFRLDVTDQASIDAAVSGTIEAFGGIDVVLNNAGYGLSGIFEAATDEQIQRQYDTNLFGVFKVTRAALPHFRSRKAGTFINVSSIGGLVTFPMVSLYHGTKWAMEGWSESLAYELEPLGIAVKIVEPGGVSTDFGTRSMDMATAEGMDDYASTQKKVMAYFFDASRAANYSTPEQIAETIYGAATDGTPRLRYVAGQDANVLWDMRKTHGDEAFRVGMKAQVFGEGASV